MLNIVYPLRSMKCHERRERERFQSDEEIDIALKCFFCSERRWLKAFTPWKERTVKYIIINENYFEHS